MDRKNTLHRGVRVWHPLGLWHVSLVDKGELLYTFVCVFIKKIWEGTRTD
jgi:hypothetical protein